MLKRIKQIIPLLILLPVAAMPQGKGQINWIEGIIRATGTDSIIINDQGSPVDEETGDTISLADARTRSYARAKEKAMESASQVITSIQVSSTERIIDIIERDPVARGRLMRVVHQYSKFREKSAGSLETACEMEFSAGYLLTMLNIDFPCDEFPLSSDTASPTLYTSLIVDVRGLGIKPMLLPSIYNETGLEIYGKNFISGNDAVYHLAVSYTFSENEAKNHKKAGKHPFFCAALKNLNGSPVLSDDDIKRVFSHKKNLAYLKKCRVIFVIDR